MSLVPNVDSTLLFVNSGMFPLAPYLGGQPHPLGKRLCNVQRCLRTNYDEMIEIGDNRHTLMFEMLGNWSLGDFTKHEQIPWVLELLVEKLELDPRRLYVSVFAGDNDAPRDQEAIEIWQKAFAKYGVEALFSEDITNLPKDLETGNSWKYRIFPYPKKKNWWERAHAPHELGGPTSEMFYDMGKVEQVQDSYHINDDSGRFIEIGNNVFMEYRLDQDLKWQPLTQKNIDFGGGFERLVMIAQGKSDIFESDVYWPIIEKIKEISGKSYKNNGLDNDFTSAFRVIADHTRAATFILADGVTPSNKDQGYILRRFIRRLIRFGKKLDIEGNFTAEIARVVIDHLGSVYPHLVESKVTILQELTVEEEKFRSTLSKGLKELSELRDQLKEARISGEQAFYIYETYGFPLELTLDELKVDDKLASEITSEFKTAEENHRNKSRSGAEQKFKGGLADQSSETIKLHTAHHLLLAALQQIVGKEIRQRGSNITAERLRIDFNLDRKLTAEELKQVEELVNHKISQGMAVQRLVLPRQLAEAVGAQMEFGAKYPDMVTVYTISSEPLAFVTTDGQVEIDAAALAKALSESSVFSKEFCGGPHVANTSELSKGGKRFLIQKQESVAAGIKRIKAVLA